VTKVVVSDHAVLRYLERISGPHPMFDDGRINVDAVRTIILSEGRYEQFAVGAAKVRIGKIEFRSAPSRFDAGTRVVVTVLEDRSPKIDRPHLSNRPGKKHRNPKYRQFERRKDRSHAGE
jgi:hypothetical protein